MISLLQSHFEGLEEIIFLKRITRHIRLAITSHIRTSAYSINSLSRQEATIIFR